MAVDRLFVWFCQVKQCGTNVVPHCGTNVVPHCGTKVSQSVTNVVPHCVTKVVDGGAAAR